MKTDLFIRLHINKRHDYSISMKRESLKSGMAVTKQSILLGKRIECFCDFYFAYVKIFIESVSHTGGQKEVIPGSRLAYTAKCNYYVNGFCLI